MTNQAIERMQRLVTVIQYLSLARTLPDVMAIVRTSARALLEADGATFVLQENGMCHYADEDAIEPLWKGQRFPLETCISGWAMINRRSVAIQDIYSDSRIPHAAYRPTFVKSLAMVPIRLLDPIGAIGFYWASNHLADESELLLAQALANTTAVAFENLRLNQQLTGSLLDREAELATAHKRIEDLEELVRMCAWTGRFFCDGEWVSAERYLEKKHNAKITHGMSEDVLLTLKKELGEGIPG